MAFRQPPPPHYLTVYDEINVGKGSRRSRAGLVVIIIIAIIAIIIAIIFIVIRKRTCGTNTDCSGTQTCQNYYCV